MAGKVLVVVVAVVALYVVLAAGALLRNRPEWGAPPGPWPRLKRYLTTNVARTGQQPGFAELAPRRYRASPRQVVDETVAAMRALGWEVVQVDATQGAVQAVVRTPWLRFRDDVTVSVDARPDGTTLLEAQSRSRLGRADFAANQHHLRVLFAALESRGLEPLAPTSPPAPAR